MDRVSGPRYAQGVAVAPDPVTPVTAIPAPDPVYPTTAVPAGGMDWYGPKHWDGWGDGPVPYPKPPEWRGPPARAGRPRVRAVLSMVLAALLGVVGLVVVFKLRAPAASPQRPSANGSHAGAPVVPTAPPSQEPSQPADQATPTPAATFDAAAIVSSAKKTVVTITSTFGQSNTRVAGTGAIVSSDGLVLVNDHIIAGATAISGVAVANGKTFQASVVGFDRSRDIALLQLAGATGLSRVTVANSSSVAVDDPVVAVGNDGAGGGPIGVTGSVTALNQSITAGQPGGGGSQRLDGLIQVAADVQSGDLGGPVIDRSGRVIGIDAAAPVDQAQGGGGKAFAIPINTALAVAQQILSGNDSATVHIGPTALLGVATADAKGQVSGAAVTGLVSGGPAERAGLNVGDVIRSVDGRGIGSVTALTAVLDTHHPGDQVEVDWIDGGGRSRRATVRLATGAAG